jgi:hypothetical protein
MLSLGSPGLRSDGLHHGEHVLDAMVQLADQQDARLLAATPLGHVGGGAEPFLDVAIVVQDRDGA